MQTFDNNDGTVATLCGTFRAYLANEADPYADPATLGHAFRPDPTVTPASLLATADAQTHPLPLLVADTGGTPRLALAPFQQHHLPGAGGGVEPYVDGSFFHAGRTDGQGGT